MEGNDIHVSIKYNWSNSSKMISWCRIKQPDHQLFALSFDSEFKLPNSSHSPLSIENKKNDNSSLRGRNDNQSETAVIGVDSLSYQYHILPPNTCPLLASYLSSTYFSFCNNEFRWKRDCTELVSVDNPCLDLQTSDEEDYL